MAQAVIHCYLIICDHCGEHHADKEQPPAPSMAAAGLRAEKDGWLRTAHMDLCPICLEVAAFHLQLEGAGEHGASAKFRPAR